MMFKENFIRLCNQKGESPSSVCRNVGIAPATFSCWTDESVPRKATLIKISDYLGVSVEDLLAEQTKEKAQPQGVELDESDSEFLTEVAKQLKEMTEDEKKDLQNYVEFLKSKRKKG